MKKNIIFILALFSSRIICGQVGINTEDPQATLHVEGNQYVSTNTKIGNGASYNTSASLELGDPNKAFLPNRVALKGAGDDKTIPDPVAGMVVYNTNSTTTLPSGLTYYNGNQWSRVITELPKTTLNLVDLPKDTKSAQIESSSHVNDGETMIMEPIVIPEDGSYAFSFRLYGNVSFPTNGRPPVGTTLIYYIGMLVDHILVDTAEMDIVFGSNNVITYSITLGAELKVSDTNKIKFVLGHNKSSDFSWELAAKPGKKGVAARTSMIWWKL